MAIHSVESIYHTHRQGLFTLALSITCCQSAAEDAVHQAFSRLSDRRLGRTNDPVAYVYQSVRNAAIDVRRRKQRQDLLGETVFNGYVPPAAAEMDDPGESVLTAERDQILRQAIDQLPDTIRQTVLLRAFSGLTFDQVGIVLGIPGKTAATQYRRALQSLQQKLKGQL